MYILYNNIFAYIYNPNITLVFYVNMPKEIYVCVIVLIYNIIYIIQIIKMCFIIFILYIRQFYQFCKSAFADRNCIGKYYLFKLYIKYQQNSRNWRIYWIHFIHTYVYNLCMYVMFVCKVVLSNQRNALGWHFPK